MSTVPRSPAGRVGLLGRPPEVLELLERVLADTGHTVCNLAASPTVATVAAEHPDVLVVVEGALFSTTTALLDALLADHATAEVPVIVLTTLEVRLGQAHASGNVYATFDMPFDLEDVLAAIGAALSRTPF